MKKKTDDKVISESILDSHLEKQTKTLSKIFRKYSDDMVINVSLIVEKARTENDDKARQYRNDILTKMEE